jgi:transposase
MLRFAVIWRKRSLGTASERGDRWAERILSLRQTCRIQGRRTFPALVEAMSAAFQDQAPDVGWIRAPGATP